jgi:hypothetical protein
MNGNILTIKHSSTQLIEFIFNITVMQKNLLLKCEFQHCIYYRDNKPMENIMAHRHAWMNSTEAWQCSFPMCRWSWVMTSTYHLTISSNHLVGISKCKELKIQICKSDVWHNVHTKNHEFPFTHSLVIKCILTDVTSEVGLDWVRLAHAQMIMNSGVINIPPHDFKQPFTLVL